MLYAHAGIEYAFFLGGYFHTHSLRCTRIAFNPAIDGVLASFEYLNCKNLKKKTSTTAGEEK